MGTYETAKALESIHTQPDPIHWSTPHSYRSNPYRQLYHQKGVVGNITVQLLQASNLKRSHWNALALGPVKYLGLSSAHGPVSSYATFRIGFVSSTEAAAAAASTNEEELSSASSLSSFASSARSAAAVGTASPMLPTPPMSSYSTSSTGRNMTSHSPSPLHYPHVGNSSDFINDANHHHRHHHHHNRHNEQEETFRSSTIPRNNNPIWPATTTPSLPFGENNDNNNDNIKSSFVIPLQKGASSCDGKRIILYVQMKEEQTAAECFVPPALRGSCHKANLRGQGEEEQEEGCIGKGCIDITGLCLGEDVPGWANTTADGVNNSGNGDEKIIDAQKVGVWDVWLDLSLNCHHPMSLFSSASASAKRATSSSSSKQQQQQQKDSNKNNKGDDDLTGKVRILISYKPNGLTPIRNDVVALESHARRDVFSSSCRPALPPLEPFKVLDVRGLYLLVQYELPLASNYNMTAMMAAAAASSSSSKSSPQDGKRHHHHRHGDFKKKKKKKKQQSTTFPTVAPPNQKRKRTGTMRLHRNAVFVIERTNLIDSTVNLALTPTDLLLSSSLGKTLVDVTGPYVEAAGDLIMPAVLSAKLLMGATKTGVQASFMGVRAATESFVRAQHDPVERNRSRRRRRRRSFG